MIYSPLSSITRSKEFALALNAVPSADGQAFANVVLNGVTGVQPTDGTVNDRFAGFVNTQTSAASFQQATAVVVETQVVPGSKLITLSRVPLAGSVLVKDLDTGAVVAPDSVVGKDVDLTSAGVPGASLTIVYRYSMTVVESRARNGDVTPGGYSGLTTGSVTLAQAGVIYTDQFDTSCDFSAANEVVVLGANGILSTKTKNPAGVPVKCNILALPSTEYPFLGLDFDTY